MGLGVYSDVMIDEGQFIAEYTGEIFDKVERDKRVADGKGTYMYEITSNLFLDSEVCGSIMRYINHSCQPNCVAYCYTVDDIPCILLYSLYHILPVSFLLSMKN